MNRIKSKIKKAFIRKKPIVVMFHSIDLENDSCTISFSKFVSFVNFFIEEIKCGKIILTFDDGYECVYKKCFEFLYDNKVPFICFLVTDFINQPNYLSKQQVFEMLQSGLLTIGSHGKTHSLLNKLNFLNLQKEIVSSKAILEENFGITVSLFAYSHGIYNNKCIRTIKKAGYHYAFCATSTLSSYAFANRYKIPRFNVKQTTVDSVTEEIIFYEKKPI